MSGQALTYNLKFQPSKYVVKEKFSPSNNFPYWDIVDLESDRPVAWAYEENTAKAIVFALDYTKAVLNGDASAQRELMSAIAKLRN